MVTSTLKVRNYLCIVLNSELFALFHLLDGFHILLHVFPKEDKGLHFTCKHKQILSISFLHWCFLCSCHCRVHLLQLTLLHFANEKQKLSKDYCDKSSLDLHKARTVNWPGHLQISNAFCQSFSFFKQFFFFNNMLWQS